MIVEIVAIRVLSPYYGNTIFTTSSVITIILTALSFGYYVGGKLADRHPSLKWFFSIIFFSGFFLLTLHFLGTIFLPLLSSIFSITWGPLLSSAFLFFLPALLLGTLSPYAIKLQQELSSHEGIGTIAGKIFFWSTAGSILGSLSAGFFLIPRFGINHIIIGSGVILVLLGLFPLLKIGIKARNFSGALFLFFIIMILVLPPQSSARNIVFSKDGVYEKITILDDFSGRPTRYFQQDRSRSGAMFLDSNNPTDLAYGYAYYYLLYKVFNPSLKNILVIGGGSYSVPNALLVEQPHATIDVSEIEPSLFDLAKTFFNVPDDKRLRNYTEDGRRLLHYSEKKYDLIFSDVYYSLFSIPAHFTTQEFFTIAKDKLNNNGVFIANLIGDLSQQESSFIMSEIKTFQTVFPNSYFFAVNSPTLTHHQNIILVGYHSDKKINMSDLISHPHPFIRMLPQKFIDTNKLNLSSYPILTDNFSPVEYLISGTLQRAFDPRVLP